MNETTESSTDEIVIVGCEYGDLADSINNLFDKKDPIVTNDIISTLESEELLLSPVYSMYDKYCIDVSTMFTRKRLGCVWMYQAPAVFKILESNEDDVFVVKVSKVMKTARAIKVVPEFDIDLSKVERDCQNLDLDWASDLPVVHMSAKLQALDTNVRLLYKHLKTDNKWSDLLEKRINDVEKYLPKDLSARHYQQIYDIYWMMDKSDDPKVNRRSEQFFYRLLHRASRDNCEMWLDNWLEDFFKDSEKRKVFALYKDAGYTLADIEDKLHQSPDNLFHIYTSDKERFPKRLYYAALPYEIYFRLLTLLAIRHLMLKEMDDSDASSVLTGKLASAEAMEYWEILQDKGFVDADYQLCDGITRKQAMYIADSYSEKLKMKSKWKPFEQLWNINNLAQEKYAMQQTGTMPALYKIIDEIFE